LAALGESARLAIVDELLRADRTPSELQELTDLPSNLLAHHLDVLESTELVTRTRSAGDGRRRYVRAERAALDGLLPAARIEPQPALFVCTANSARSQLAAALWRERSGHPAASAGTHPAERVHPGARAAAERHGLAIDDEPHHLDDVRRPRLVITVCDRAHEEVHPPPGWLHWSIPDPMPVGTRAAFDATVRELRARIDALLLPADAA